MVKFITSSFLQSLTPYAPTNVRMCMKRNKMYNLLLSDVIKKGENNNLYKLYFNNFISALIYNNM